MLRPVDLASGDPYRAEPAALPVEHTVEPRSLASVLAALRDAGVPFRARRRGFDMFGSTRTRVMPVRVHDPAEVTPTTMTCGSEAPELLLALALVLVPLFGPVLAHIPFAGRILVDGTRDRRALGAEAAHRIEHVSRRAAVRAPVTVPILLELAERMRLQR